jgi:photosystem II stability/assembly factor-like uncharacterized protein
MAWRRSARLAACLGLALALSLPHGGIGDAAAAPQWEKVGGPIGGLGYNVRVHPTNKNIIFVTDAWSGVNRSTDGGLTWQPANTGITTRVGPSNDAIPVFSLTIDKLNPNIVWVGTQGIRGIFKSGDGGLSYTRMENGITENTGLTIRNFEIHPTGIQGTEFEKVKGVIYKTTNGGTSWSKIWEGDSLTRWLCIEPGNPQELTVATGIFDREAFNTTGLGVLRSIDGGANWTPSNTGITGSLFVGAMMERPGAYDTLIIGTGNNNEVNAGTFGGVFKSVNGGTNWTQVLGPQDPTHPSPDNIFTAVAFAPSNPNIVYIGNPAAFYRSADGGNTNTWTRHGGPNGAPSYGPPGVRAGVPIEITVDADDPNTVFVNNYGGGVFKSIDGAQTWQVLSKGYTGADIHQVAVSAQNRHIIAANGRSGPFRSTNGGADWAGLAFGVAGGFAEWYSVAIHPTNSAVILLGDEHKGVILRSTDSGAGWTEVFRHPSVNGSNPTTRHGPKELAFAASDPQIVYAGFAWQNFYADPVTTNIQNSFGVYKSIDGGAHWTAKNTGLESTNLNITALAVSRTDPALAIVGTRGSGIFKTTNGGDQWLNISGNLPTGYIYGIGLTSDPNTMYAATKDAGVFKTTNGGTIWTQVLNAQLSNPPYDRKLMMAVVVNPENDSVVFAGDWRSGIYHSTDAGASWQLLNSGLTTRAINSLVFSADGGVLYAGTKGEGVFALQITTASDGVAATAFVTRLYQTVLLREPDPAGLATHVQNIQQFGTVIPTVLAFFKSQEFLSQSLSDQQFIDRLYHTFLNRAPDEAGLTAFLALLQSGCRTRDTLIADLTFSPEFKALLPPVPAADPRVPFVAELYAWILNRPADLPGLQSFVSQLQRSTVLSTVLSFLHSAEFTTPRRSATDYVSALYLVALGRAPDCGGLQSFVDALNPDTDAARDQLLAQFASSQEFQAKLNQLFP